MNFDAGHLFFVIFVMFITTAYRLLMLFLAASKIEELLKESNSNSTIKKVKKSAPFLKRITGIYSWNMETNSPQKLRFIIIAMVFGYLHQLIMVGLFFVYIFVPDLEQFVFLCYRLVLIPEGIILVVRWIVGALNYKPLKTCLVLLFVLLVIFFGFLKA